MQLVNFYRWFQSTTLSDHLSFFCLLGIVNPKALGPIFLKTRHVQGQNIDWFKEFNLHFNLSCILDSRKAAG
jgi:hypothetical protein